ncbi:hypothetical protein JAO29_15460 [Edaphobacter sp. HDX4]|uniref:hypothetical protein n=1 Tax=Edaphobacter sp. HDX4 TaxID=2794064 RepID=UPI002FE5F598
MRTGVILGHEFRDATEACLRELDPAELPEDRVVGILGVLAIGGVRVLVLDREYSKVQLRLLVIVMVELPAAGSEFANPDSIEPSRLRLPRTNKNSQWAH